MEILPFFTSLKSFLITISQDVIVGILHSNQASIGDPA